MDRWFLIPETALLGAAVEYTDSVHKQRAIINWSFGRVVVSQHLTHRKYIYSVRTIEGNGAMAQQPSTL